VVLLGLDREVSMTMVRSVVAAIVVALLATLPSVARAGDNPLIGEWQLVGGEPMAKLGGHCPSRGIVFTPTTEILMDTDTQVSAEVRYRDLGAQSRLTSGLFISVIDTNQKTGDVMVTYRVYGEDRIERADYINCIFQRSASVGRAQSPAVLPHVSTYEDAQRAIEEMQNPSQPHVMTYDEAIEAIGKMK
jgi:hypothetical protein